MPDGDTAVLEAPATAAVVEAPPAETLPETSIDEQAPETDALESPETEADGLPDLSTLPPEKLAELPEVKALLASHGESMRRQQERADHQRQIEQGAVAFDNRVKATTEQAMGQTVGALLAKNKAWADLYAEGKAESPAPPLEVLRDDLTKYAQQADTIGQVRVINEATASLSRWVPDITKEDIAWRDEARGTPVFWERHNALIAADAINKHEAQKAAEAKANGKAEADVQKLQANARERAGQPQPTRANGTGRPAVDNRTILQTAHPLSAEYRAAFKAEHGYDAPGP